LIAEDVLGNLSKVVNSVAGIGVDGNRAEPESSVPCRDERQLERRIDLVYNGLLIGAAKPYFTYASCTLCGIPKIRVEGTKEDWLQIKALVSGLSGLDELQEISPFYQWVNDTVLDNIIGLYEGKEDLRFWSSIAKDKSGSGFHGVTGWLPSLSLYAQEGEIRPLDQRWSTDKGNIWLPDRGRIPIVNITLEANNALGWGNSNPTLSVNLGFTSVSKKDGFLKPVLGIDAYIQDKPVSEDSKEVENDR